MGKELCGILLNSTFLSAQADPQDEVPLSQAAGRGIGQSGSSMSIAIVNYHEEYGAAEV